VVTGIQSENSDLIKNCVAEEGTPYPHPGRMNLIEE